MQRSGPPLARTLYFVLFVHPFYQEVNPWDYGNGTILTQPENFPVICLSGSVWGCLKSCSTPSVYGYATHAWHVTSCDYCFTFKCVFTFDIDLGSKKTLSIFSVSLRKLCHLGAFASHLTSVTSGFAVFAQNLRDLKEHRNTGTPWLRWWSLSPYLSSICIIAYHGLSGCFLARLPRCVCPRGGAGRSVELATDPTGQSSALNILSNGHRTQKPKMRGSVQTFQICFSTSEIFSRCDKCIWMWCSMEIKIDQKRRLSFQRAEWSLDVCFFMLLLAARTKKKMRESLSTKTRIAPNKTTPPVHAKSKSIGVVHSIKINVQVELFFALWTENIWEMFVEWPGWILEYLALSCLDQQLLLERFQIAHRIKTSWWLSQNKKTGTVIALSTKIPLTVSWHPQPIQVLRHDWHPEEAASLLGDFLWSRHENVQIYSWIDRIR